MKIFLIQAFLTYILFIVGIKIYGLHSGVITFAPFLVAIILIIDLLLMFFIRNRITEKWHLLLFLILYELLFLIFTGHFSFTYVFDKDDDIRRLNICYAIPIVFSTVIIFIYKKLSKATQ